MSEIADTDWQLIRFVFGDIAYEEPHNHSEMLKAARITLLEQYSRGELPGRLAAEKLGFRSTAELLVALGTAGLPMPRPPEEEVRKQVKTFASLFRENQEARAEAKEIAEGLAHLNRGESLSVDVVLAKAQAILDRAPNLPSDPGDELPE